MGRSIGVIDAVRGNTETGSSFNTEINGWNNEHSITITRSAEIVLPGAELVVGGLPLECPQEMHHAQYSAELLNRECGCHQTRFMMRYRYMR